ncbi:zinc finger BED domain-containing protein 4-like [Rhizophagus clarus]|uniref:Zinc finger BED domain-containing protein 4-like n=1 Tax=Rhizophagus clarus TaxID=94130 RepID=A0A8H3LPX0_9GLOM|nr:zinc finger BED domain-containing protein 4-like [Rhizophagus clarus]
MNSSSIENDQNNQNITQKKEVVHKNEVGCGSDHLSGKHQIIKETIKQNYVPLESYGLEIPPHKESRQIELCNLLVSWIISDTQPLNITQSKFFQKFIKELDLAFDIPNVKLIKQTIHSTYNHTLPLIQKFVEKNAISVSLTTDMWTGRNRQGFLAQNISDALFVILDNWGLREKTNIIVTNNRNAGKTSEYFLQVDANVSTSSNEWELLQQLVITLGPFEEATNYLGKEKYITYNIISPIIEQIKNLLYLSLSNSSSSSTPTSPVTSFNTSEIYQEIENAANVFVVIEKVGILENDNIENNNNQTRKDKIDLDKPLETKDFLDKVKKDLYNAIVKLMNNKEDDEEILYKKYEEYKENYLLTPIEFCVSSPTPSESSSVILNLIYKPKFFSIFKQNQPRATNEVEEYLKEDNISFIQYPFSWWLNKKYSIQFLLKWQEFTYLFLYHQKGYFLMQKFAISKKI